MTRGAPGLTIAPKQESQAPKSPLRPSPRKRPLPQLTGAKLKNWNLSEL